MSQASIEIYTNLLLNRQQLIDGLQETKGEVAQWSQEVQAQQIGLTLTADFATLRTMMQAFRDEQEAIPISIPVIMNAQDWRDGMEAMRAEAASGFSSFGGTGSGGPSSASGFSGNATAAATAAAMVAGGGAYELAAGGALGGSAYSPSAYAVAGEDLAAGWGPDAGFMGNFANLANGPLAGSQTGLSGSYAQATGFTGTQGGGGFGSEFGGTRALFRGLLAIRAGADTAEAGGDLLGEAYSSLSGDPIGAESYRLAGEKAIEHLPLVGKSIADLTGGVLGDFGRGLITGDFSSRARDDIAYGTKTTAAAKEEDKVTERMHREARAELRHEESLSKQVAREQYENQISNLSGSDRADAMQQFGIKEIDSEFSGAEYRTKEGGPLTAAASELRQAEIDKLNNEIWKTRRRNFYEEDQFNAEYGNIDPTSDNQRMAQFRQSEDLKEEAIRLTSESDAQKFHVFRSLREREEQGKLSRSSNLENAESGDRVDTMQTSATEATMRAKGEIYKADTIAFNAAQDDQMAKLQERYDFETNEAKKANIAKEMTALGTTQNIQTAARTTIHSLADTSAAQGISEQARETVFRTSGDSYSAQLSAINYQEASDYGRFIQEGDTASAAAAMRRGIAQRAALNEGETEKYAHLKNTDEQMLLRADHRGGQADVLGIRDEIAQMQRDAGDDPEKLSAVRAHGTAEIATERRALTESLPVFGIASPWQQWDLQNQHAVEGQHTKDAIKALNKLQEDINISGVPGNSSVIDPNSDFKVGSVALLAAANALKNLQNLYVVRN